jgi:hypothetical protein
MYIYLFIFLIIVLILLFSLIRLKNIEKIHKSIQKPIIFTRKNKIIQEENNSILRNNNYESLQINSELINLNNCQVPSLNTEQCYKSRFYECPIVNGSHLQCTNNYIPQPTQYNADCGNRTFEMVPYPWKISENCYYNKINFDRNKKYDKVKFV